jgi:hypothetical protein
MYIKHTHRRLRTGNWDGAKKTPTNSPAFMVTLGPNEGTGILPGGFHPPDFLVAAFKGKVHPLPSLYSAHPDLSQP